MKQKLIAKLKALLGDKWFIRDSEDFDGTPGGVWTTNERCSVALDGGLIMEDFQVHPKIAALLEECGFFCEAYDAGTLMFFPK